MTQRTKWRSVAVVLAVLAVVASAGTAAAFWRATATGSGTGLVGTTVAITLAAGTAGADLYPGGAAAVSTTANNTNGVSVRIGSLALDTTEGTGGFAVDAGHSGCPTSTFGFVTQSNGGAGWTTAGNGSLAITMPASLTMSTSAANACQGVVVTLYLKAQP